MNSGWDKRISGESYCNADADGVMHFPGFHIEAVEFLLRKRNVNGIAVDTLSLDRGPSDSFPVHCRWLSANRWGLENVANLGKVPPEGATLIAAGPVIVGASGGPTRVLALV
jgi:kynurenine formamidase